MKRFATYTLLVFLAALVMYGGAGVNFVSYCCGDCEAEGIEALVLDKCCDIHEHSHDPHFSHASETTHTHGCDIKRVDFEWTLIQDQAPDSQPVSFDLFLSDIPHTIPYVVSGINTYGTIMLTGPPIVCPRAYLSLLTTLLI